jgi:hypothetical protein
MLSAAQHELRTLRSIGLDFILTVGARKFIGALKAIMAGEHLMVKMCMVTVMLSYYIKEINIVQEIACKCTQRLPCCKQAKGTILLSSLLGSFNVQCQYFC